MRVSAAYWIMLAGTPTGTSPERCVMCTCRPPSSTRTCTQPWHGAMVVRGCLPAPLTWYGAIHGSTKWVRSSGSSRSCSTRCLNWSNGWPSGAGKEWKAPPYDPGPRPPGSMPFLSVFSGVAQGPHQSTPNSSNSFSVVAPLMNAHSSPMGLRQNDLMLRSVMTGNPWARGNVIVCCMTVSALTPCLVSVSIPAPRLRSRTRRYSVDAGRWSYGRYSIARQFSGADFGGGAPARGHSPGVSALRLGQLPLPVGPARQHAFLAEFVELHDDLPAVVAAEGVHDLAKVQRAVPQSLADTADAALAANPRRRRAPVLHGVAGESRGGVQAHLGEGPAVGD